MEQTQQSELQLVLTQQVGQSCIYKELIFGKTHFYAGFQNKLRDGNTCILIAFEQTSNGAIIYGSHDTKKVQCYKVEEFELSGSQPLVGEQKEILNYIYKEWMKTKKTLNEPSSLPSTVDPSTTQNTCSTNATADPIPPANESSTSSTSTALALASNESSSSTSSTAIALTNESLSSPSSSSSSMTASMTILEKKEGKELSEDSDIQKQVAMIEDKYKKITAANVPEAETKPTLPKKKIPKTRNDEDLVSSDGDSATELDEKTKKSNKKTKRNDYSKWSKVNSSSTIF